MKHPKSCKLMIMILTLGIVITGVSTVKEGITKVKEDVTKARNIIEANCATEVSTENWQIKACITTSGEVSQDTIENICKIIQNDVHPEAYRYLVNSGGKIIIVEGDDITEYITKNYETDTSDVDDKIKGYCPYFRDKYKMLQKVDIVIASEGVSSLQHEFYHALDYSHNYSRTKEFLKIYEDAEEICRKVFTSEKAIEYYSSKPEEFFAEMSVKYYNGELNEVSSELEAYLAGVV